MPDNPKNEHLLSVNQESYSRVSFSHVLVVPYRFLRVCFNALRDVFYSSANAK